MKAKHKPPPKPATPAPTLTEAVSQHLESASLRFDLKVFALMATVLVALILWRPISRGEIAYNVAPILRFQPWSSYPEMRKKYEAIVSRPLIGAVASPTDAESTFYPWMRFAIGRLRQGRWPLWLPFAAGGSPFIGNQQSAVFNPFHVLFYLFDTLETYNLVFALSVFLSGLFTFLLALRLGMRREGSWFAGGIACLAPAIFAFSSHPHSYTVAFFPALLWAAEKFVEERSRRSLLDVAAVVAILTSFGAPEVAIACFLQAGLYVLVRLAQSDKGSSEEKFIAFAEFLFAGGAAAALMAVHLLPSAEYYRLSYAAKWRTQLARSTVAPYSRPITPTDIMPLAIAIAAAGASIWAFLRCRDRVRQGRGPWAHLAACGLGLGLSLALLMLLGSDETFVNAFIPGASYSTTENFPIGGVVCEALCLLALLDPELPAGIGALVPGAAIAFALSYRFFGLAHLASVIPMLGLGMPEYHSSVLGPVTGLVAAWGIERLLRGQDRPRQTRLNEAYLFASMAVLLPVSAMAAFPLKSSLAKWVDVGLHPHVLQVNGRLAGGIMGGGRQRFLGESHMIRGWYDSSLPVTQVGAAMVRQAGVGDEAEVSVHPGGDRTYFEARVKGTGTPNVFFMMPGSPPAGW